MAGQPFVAQRVTLTPAAAANLKHDLNDQGKEPVGFHIYGPCPLCSDETSDVFPISQVVLEVAGLGEAAAAAALRAVHARGLQPLPGWQAMGPEPRPGRPAPRPMGLPRGKGKGHKPAESVVAVLTCRCLEQHAAPAPAAGVPGVGGAVVAAPNQPGPAPGPGGHYGCGASWLTQVSFDDKGQLQTISGVDGVASARIWAAAEAAATSTPGSLVAAQAAATSWGSKALTPLLALGSVATIAGGHDTLQKLPGIAQGFIGASAAVSVIAAAAAVLYGAAAQSGFPVRRKAGTPVALKNADLVPLQQAAEAGNALLRALLAAAVAIAASLGALGLFLFVHPHAAADSDHVEVTFTDGARTSTVCSTVTVNADGSLTVKPGLNGADTSRLPPGQVSALAPC